MIESYVRSNNGIFTFTDDSVFRVPMCIRGIYREAHFNSLGRACGYICALRVVLYVYIYLIDNDIVIYVYIISESGMYMAANYLITARACILKIVSSRIIISRTHFDSRY